MKTKLYALIANLVSAHANCVATQKNDAAAHHRDKLAGLTDGHMPSGSGFDNGTTLDLDASSEDKLVFNTAFHHMNENGFYDGWTEHKVYVTPSLAFGFDLRITGKDRNDIKDYIHECFASALKVETE